MQKKSKKRTNISVLYFSSFLHIFRGSSTRDNLDQLAGNDSLSGTVVQDLVLANHLTSVLGGVLRDLISAAEKKKKKDSKINNN